MNANVDPAPASSPANGKRRNILMLIAVIFIVLGALWAAYWVLVLSKRERTDDAYVNGNKVVISAQISGTVIAVLADDTQLVKAGQVLVRMDPVDAQTSLSRTASALAQTVRQVRQERATADQSDSIIEIRKLELAQSEADLAKREPLLADHAIAPEEVRHARESVDLARAALTQAQRQSLSSHALVDGTQVEDNPSVLQAKAAYRDAWVAAQRNAVVAPVTGYVAERSVQLGQHIQAGQALMTVIQMNSLWVDANFKEVQLRHLRIGQPAEVRSDLYGGTFIFPATSRHVGRYRRGVLAAAGAKCIRQLDQVVQRVPVRTDRRRRPRQIAAARGLVRHRHGGYHQARRPGAGNGCDHTPVGDTQVYTQDSTRRMQRRTPSFAAISNPRAREPRHG
jgi:membrane fusion protein (multidrug efflux system)